MLDLDVTVFKKIKNLATTKDGILAKSKKKKKGKKKKRKKIININNPLNQLNLINNPQPELEIQDLEEQIQNTEDEFNLNKEGKIELAKIHSSANRPLNKINEFNSDTKFCMCCNLPSEQDDVLIRYNFCSNTDKFSECGEGIALYFTFFKFCVVVLFIASVIIGSLNMVFNYKNTEVIIDFCNNYLKNALMPYNDTTFLDECQIYFTEVEKNSEFFNYDNKIFFKFSATNVENYRKIFKKIYKSNNNFNKIIFNINIINFICLLSLFIINLIFIFFIYNKNRFINYQYLRPSDYTVCIGNLYDIHKKFLYIKKEISDKKNSEKKTERDDTNIDLEYKEKLGIDIPLSQIKNESDEFKYFFKFYLNNIFPTGSTNLKESINNIVLVSKLAKYQNLEKKIEEISQKINKIKYDESLIDINNELNLEGDDRKYIEYKFKFMCFKFCKKETTLLNLNKEKENTYKAFDELYNDTKKNTLNYFAGTSFITFNTLKEKEEFLKNFEYSFFGKIFKKLKNYFDMIFGYFINKNNKPFIWFKDYQDFEEADEPSDITFENLEYKKLSRLIRFLGVYSVSFLFALFSDSICFLVIAGLNKLLDYINKKYPHPIVQYATSLVISCFSTFLNYIYANIFHILTKFEKTKTMTKYYLSYSIKLTISTFINSGLLPLLGEIYNPSEGHKTLINNMLMIFILNSIYTPIKWTLNFSYFGKRINIWLIERKKDPDEEHGKTQKELNDLYELPNMEISVKYSYIAKTILMTFLYIPLFPLGIIISLAGFIIGYFCEKFNFCTIYKKPEVLGAEICKFYIDYFVIVFFIYALGDFLFLSEAYDNKLWSYINLIVFGSLIFVPYVKPLSYDFLKIKKSEIFKNEYKDVCMEFSEDYERANPISKKEGKLNFLKILKDNKIINEEVFLECVKDIYNVNIMQIYYKNKNIVKEKEKNNKKENKNNNSIKDSINKDNISIKNNKGENKINFYNKNVDNKEIENNKKDKVIEFIGDKNPKRNKRKKKNQKQNNQTNLINNSNDNVISSNNIISNIGSSIKQKFMNLKII